MNKKSNKTQITVADDCKKLSDRDDAKAQTSYRYFCRKCGTVTYSEAICGVYCRKCGNGPL